MISVRDFLRAVISQWEGGYSSDPDDPGNWAGDQLLGSMRGVTPAILAQHRGMSARSLTPADMQAVTLDEAVDIGEQLFYIGGKLNLLTWAPATANLLDFGWGSGDYQAIKSMQRIVGVADDGIPGPITAKAYNEWLTTSINPAKTIYDMRCDFYREIAAGSVLAKYLQGWLNRAAWALKTAV